MDVRHPISAVVPSVDGMVLASLARTTEHKSLTEIQRFVSGASVSGVRRVLQRLVRVGVVASQGVPPRYALNREHLGFPAIELLVRMRTLLLDRIRSHIETWDPPPHLVGVFGSFARADGDETSDIDVLVVGDADDAKISDLVSAIEAWTGNGAHVVVLSESEYSRITHSDEPIASAWERDLIAISGTLEVPA